MRMSLSSHLSNVRMLIEHMKSLPSLPSSFPELISPSPHSRSQQLIFDHTDSSQPRMRAENVWQWLDAVDQDDLDLLDQWGVPSPRHPSRSTSPGSDSVSRDGDGEPWQQYDGKRNTDIGRTLESTPPSGIPLRNGSIRMTGGNSTFFAYDVVNENHPKSLVPGLPTNVAHDVKSETPSRLLFPGITTSEATGHRVETPAIRQLPAWKKEGNSDSLDVVKIVIRPGLARTYLPSGNLQSAPVIQTKVMDPLAINCQGARVVGGYEQHGLQNFAVKSRRNTSAADTALHRSNALKRPLNVRPLLKMNSE